MKKLVLTILVFATISACHKKNAEPEITENNPEDSIAAVETANYKPVFTQSKPLQNVSVQETENIVGAHENDTIYVTNFFATWCGPCMREIPHFKEKMEEMKSQPIKFTFVSLDEKSDWETEVKSFAEKNNLGKNIVLLDGTLLNPEFFSQNFKTWDGGSIPFTLIRKGDKTDETVGMMSKEMLAEKLNALK